jgi:hypothetical protein
MIYAGDDWTFSAGVVGEIGNLTYQWTFRQLLGVPQDIPGATLSSYTLSNAATTDFGSYGVTVTDDGLGGPGYPKSVSSSRASLQVVEHMTIVSQPASMSLQTDESGAFSVTVSGGMGTITYQWTKDGTANPITDATTSVYSIASMVSTDAGAYSCVVADDNETLVSAIANLVWTSGTGVPVAGLAGLSLLTGAFAIAGAFRIRRKK